MNVEMFGDGFDWHGAHLRGGGQEAEMCELLDNDLRERKNTGLHHFTAPGWMTNRWKTPLSLQTVWSSVRPAVFSWFLAPLRRKSAAQCYEFSLLIYRRREYTQSERMLMLLTVFLFITTWTPQDILDPKCYLFFYTVYLHLRKYPTLNCFRFFNFLLPVTFLFKNNNIQVLIVMSNAHQALDKCMARQIFAIHMKTFLSNSLLEIWGQTQKYNRFCYCMSPFIKWSKSIQTTQMDYRNKRAQWCTSHRPLIMSNNTHHMVSSKTLFFI